MPHQSSPCHTGAQRRWTGLTVRFMLQTRCTWPWPADPLAFFFTWMLLLDAGDGCGTRRNMGGEGAQQYSNKTRRDLCSLIFSALSLETCNRDAAAALKSLSLDNSQSLFPENQARLELLLLEPGCGVPRSVRRSHLRLLPWFHIVRSPSQWSEKPTFDGQDVTKSRIAAHPGWTAASNFCLLLAMYLTWGEPLT